MSDAPDDPSVETIRGDREHGATFLSIRACAALRDRAIELSRGTCGGSEDWTALAALARALREARPSMVVVENRVNRVMADADGDPSAVADRASRVVDDARWADSLAAEHAASELDGVDHVLTLSRSGTVRETLVELAPERVSVAESRPGGEGVGVAETLADDCNVTLLPDSGVAHALSTTAVDAVLVGADTVLPDGRVVNKVGTRAALLLADRESVPGVVVAARDKVSPRVETDFEPRPPEELYAGTASFDVLAPTFDVSPAAVATLVTEAGTVGVDEVASVAREMRARGRWDESGKESR